MPSSVDGAKPQTRLLTDQAVAPTARTMPQARMARRVMWCGAAVMGPGTSVRAVADEVLMLVIGLLLISVRWDHRVVTTLGPVRPGPSGRRVPLRVLSA